MDEQSKAARRRYNDGAFHSRYFVGAGLDIGAGQDPLTKFFNEFRQIKSVTPWDVPDGDAQLLDGLTDSSYDFVHSSHCLEHMNNVVVALHNWLRVLKTGGYLIVTIPDEDMYEQGVWPSRFNNDHKHTFTIYKPKSWSPVSVNLIDLPKLFNNIRVERITLLNSFYKEDVVRDQTMQANVESAIEFIWKKL